MRTDSTVTVGAVGADRLPRAVRDLLAEHAATARVAAETLARALHSGQPDHAAGELERLEATGDRILHDLQRSAASRRLAGADRLTLLKAADRLDTVIDRLDDLAHAASIAPSVPAAQLAFIMRDACRALARLTEHLDRDPDLVQRQTEHARELATEARVAARAARARVLDHAASPMAALREAALIDEVTRAAAAIKDAAAALEHLSSRAA